MSKNGGYLIIDCGEISFTTGVPKVIEGVYDRLESCSKAVLISGVELDGTEYGDVFVNLRVSGSSFTGEFYSGAITINDDDEIIFN